MKPIEYHRVYHKEVQVNQDYLKLSDTHQLLVYADDFNVWSRNIHTIKKNIED